MPTDIPALEKFLQESLEEFPKNLRIKAKVHGSFVLEIPEEFREGNPGGFFEGTPVGTPGDVSG